MKIIVGWREDNEEKKREKIIVKVKKVEDKIIVCEDG